MAEFGSFDEMAVRESFAMRLDPISDMQTMSDKRGGRV
jgi:hypothetical protein